MWSHAKKRKQMLPNEPGGCTPFTGLISGRITTASANAIDDARMVFTSAHGHGLRAVEPCNIFACEHMLYTKTFLTQQQNW